MNDLLELAALNDDALAVRADALIANGDPLGAFVNHGLQDVFAGDLLAAHCGEWFRGLALRGPGRWAHGRLVHARAKGSTSLRQVLSEASAFKSVRSLDLRDFRQLTPGVRRSLWRHPLIGQLERLELMMPWTWLETHPQEVNDRRLPLLVVHSAGLVLELQPRTRHVSVSGKSSLRAIAVRRLAALYDVTDEGDQGGSPRPGQTYG